MAVADFFISVVQAVDGADDEVGRKNLAVVDVAGNLDVDGQSRKQFDFRRAVVKQASSMAFMGCLERWAWEVGSVKRAMAWATDAQNV